MALDPRRFVVIVLLAIFCSMVGLSTGFACREQFKRGASIYRAPYLIGVIFYVSMVLLPLAVYFFIKHPTWCFLYFFQANEISLVHNLALVILPPILAAFGFLLNAWLCQGQKPIVALALTILSVVGLLTACYEYIEPLSHLTPATSLQDQQGLGSHVAIFAFAIPIAIGGWVFLLLLYEVEGRKIRRSSEMRSLAVSSPTATLPSQPGSGPSAERSDSNNSSSKDASKNSRSDSQSRSNGTPASKVQGNNKKKQREAGQ